MLYKEITCPKNQKRWTNTATEKYFQSASAPFGSNLLIPESQLAVVFLQKAAQRKGCGMYFLMSHLNGLAPAKQISILSLQVSNLLF